MALRVDLHFPETPALDTAFEVHRAELADALSELFRLDLVAFSPQPDIDPRELLGQPVEVRLRDEPLLPQVTGIVSAARRHTAETTGTTEYRIAVVPPQWLLTRARQTCIYQDASAPEIARQVLSRHGPRMPVPADLPAGRRREYCVQYGETDLDFVFRVLAEDGIATLFDHRRGGAWLFTDDTAGGAVHVEDPIVFNPANLTPGGPAVLRWAEIGEIETARVTRRDYDFTKPGFVLQSSAAERSLAPAEASLEDYAYATGAFSAGGQGDGLVASRIEATRALVRRLALRTNFAAGAGARLHVTGPDVEGDWVVVRSHTYLESGADGRTQRTHELVVIPAETPFRPRPWNKPRAFGVQTAFVVGDTPAGTVDTDEHGRVKVEFRWDRRDLGKGNPTRWVRVAQAWAGPGYGFVTLPRVGDEVLVAYSEGDPDMPIVVGRVHNAVSATPLLLPEADRTKAIWKSQSFGPGGPVEGHNMVMMDDAAGAEVLEIRAQKDFRSNTLRHSSAKVGVNQDLVVGGNQSVEVQGHQSVKVKNNASLKAERILIQADTQLSEVAHDIALAATNSLQLSAGGERLDVSGTKHHFESPAIFLHGKDGVQVVTDKFHVHAGTEIVLQAGGSTIKLSGAGIEIQSGSMVKINGSFVTIN